MNRALFRATFKQHRKKVAVISMGIILYEGLLTWVYPVIAKNPAVTEIAGSIPSAVKTVFGVPENARTDTFESFISGQFFARIWVMLMALYGIQIANALLAKMVDDGSLAFLLSTPVSRSEILSTQTGVMVSTNAILVAAMIGGVYLGTFCSGIKIEHARYIDLGLLGLSFFSLIEFYSLFFSAWFVEEERAVTYATGLTLAFYGMDIVGGLSDRLSWLKNLSLFQWFQPQEVLEGTTDPLWPIIGFSVTSAGLWYLTKKVFETKDLAI
ncbi:ABC transporter permease subunit [Desulfosporosinus fructosivorans]